MGEQKQEDMQGVTPSGPGLSPSVEPLRVSPADAASIPNACDWCEACCVPVGIGACRNCRETAWGLVLSSQAPKPPAQPDHQMFALAISVGMGAAAEIVRRKWGDYYAQCVLNYITDFDQKRTASAMSARQGQDAQQLGAQPASAVGASRDAQPIGATPGDHNTEQGEGE